MSETATIQAPDYEQFLRSKVAIAKDRGQDVALGTLNPKLKPHQAAIARWAIRGGNRAIFASFGLGKTLIQVQILKSLHDTISPGAACLIVCPLGVKGEFVRDAKKFFHQKFQYVRTNEEFEAAYHIDGQRFFLTNYERIRDGNLDPSNFPVVSLDEASILRGFGGTKTFREFMRQFEFNPKIKHKFVATATPSPNDYIELLAYAAFLDVMDVGQAKTRFFKRDSTKADKLTLHPHKEREFWLWVSTWAIFVNKPSDIDPSFSDEGYELPALNVHWHELPTNHLSAGHETSGQGKLLRTSSIGVRDAAREKRDSLGARIERLVQIVRHERVFQSVLPSQQREVSGAGTGALSEKQGSREGAQPGMAGGESGAVPRTDSTPLSSKPRKGNGSQPGVVCEEQSKSQGDEPQEQTAEGVRTYPAGVRFTVGKAMRALPDLPEADDKAGGGSRSRNAESKGPTVSHLQCGIGWIPGQHRDTSESDQVPSQFIIWCDRNDEQRAIEGSLNTLRVSHSSLDGAMSIEDREAALEQWRAGETDAFVSKPVMYGAGVNLQQCSHAIFVGIGFKFSEFIQAIARIHRFLQTRPVRIDLIYTEAERDVRRNLETKWAKHNELVAQMTAIIRQYGLAANALQSELGRSFGVEREEVAGENFTVVNNDAVIETRRMEPDSAHLILTSIPFSTQYEYTPSYNDFGHTDSNEHFWQQMDFLTPELLRVLKPGRVAAIHVKDRIVPGGMTGLGFQTVYPFHSDCISHFKKHGFAFLGMKTIVTDVVRENNQTYRLGWTEQCKDGSRMGAGMPEYLLLFRKPPTDRSNGYADDPVVKNKSEYSRSRWQIDAHGFMRSSGNRLLLSEDLDAIPHEKIFKLFRQHSLTQVYDFEKHVELSESLERCPDCRHIHTGQKQCGDHCPCLKSGGRLPVTFMLLQPQSWHPDVWTDITRMRTLNGAQSAAGREMHLCPLQFDIAERVINQFSMPGETVFDPFMGIGTVPYMAVQMKRKGYGIELSHPYFVDAVTYCRMAERKVATPTLFELEEVVA